MSYDCFPMLIIIIIIDCRYRQVPTFGQDTIQKFRSNTSELKKMAARDFEDLLQVVTWSMLLVTFTYIDTVLDPCL